MPSPDLIAPDRMEELLGGALPEAELEARLQGLVRELRADAPVAPARLRARVQALGEQPARRRTPLPRRRTALALAFVLLVFAAIGAGVALRGGEAAPQAAEAVETSEAAATSGDAGGAAMQPSGEAVQGPTAYLRR